MSCPDLARQCRPGGNCWTKVSSRRMRKKNTRRSWQSAESECNCKIQHSSFCTLHSAFAPHLLVGSAFFTLHLLVGSGILHSTFATPHLLVGSAFFTLHSPLCFCLSVP